MEYITHLTSFLFLLQKKTFILVGKNFKLQCSNLFSLDILLIKEQNTLEINT